MNPADEYSRRLRDREERAARFESSHQRVANVRIGIVIAAAAAAWLSYGRELFSPLWLLVAAVAFAAAVLRHSTLRRLRTQAQRAVAVYRNGLARIEDRWMGQGQRGERFEDPHHVYSADLDLFGTGGLFELLCLARTRMGEDALARWLLSPAAVAEIKERQAAVEELRPRLDLREDLAVAGDRPTVGVRPEALSAWAEAPNRLPQRWLRWVAMALAVLAMASAAVWGAWGLASPFLGVLLAEGYVTYAFRKQLQQTVHETETAFEDLTLLCGVLERLEREQFASTRLRTLMQDLRSHSMAASEAIGRLRTIVQLIESRRNPILRTLDVPLMYSVQVAIAAEAWRQEHGKTVRSWLAVTGEIEALISLAAYGYEHPADPFPQLIDGPASLQVEAIGHPLIAAANCVRNDVSILGATRVLLVSGSNMSGKSTLLRSVGINTVLAMAGAPVRARRMQLTALQVGASIRINDSLHEGSSRFYAEITRLRQIYDLAAREPPAPQLLFLLDELLQGTNSADRRVGAEGIVKALLERNAIGLISTHDLALTGIGGPGNTQLENVHFQDELRDGRMHFDFKLRPGVVTRSNALDLMRAIGLDV